MEVAQLSVRRRMSAAHTDAGGAGILSDRRRIAVVPRVHRPVTGLSSAIAVSAAVAAFPSIIVLGWFSTVNLLLHMKDLRV
jgi:hypothetical protein